MLDKLIYAALALSLIAGVMGWCGWEYIKSTGRK